VSLILSNGASFQPLREIRTCTRVVTAVLADFDQDSNLDLAVLCGSELEMLHGDGAGGFTDSARDPRPAAVGFLVSAGFHGGHIPALALAGGNWVAVWFGSPEGALVRQADILAPSLLTSVSIAAGDFNGDGLADLALSSGGPAAAVVVFLGQRDGSFQMSFS